MKYQIPHHTGIPSVFLLGQVSCANALSHGRPSSDTGCDFGQVLFRCALGLLCSVGHRCCQCCLLSPLCHSHPPTHSILQAFTVRSEYSIESCKKNVLHIHLFVFLQNVYIRCILDKNREQRREDEKTWCSTV